MKGPAQAMIRPSMKRPMFTSLLVVLGAVALVALLGAWGLRALEPLLIYHPTGAPRLGEHTADVLATSIGLEPAELDALRARGIV